MTVSAKGGGRPVVGVVVYGRGLVTRGFYNQRRHLREGDPLLLGSGSIVKGVKRSLRGGTTEGL